VHGERKMRLLFIGDSLIEYFDWQERFPKNAVYNMGVAGETVEGLYARLPVIYTQLDVLDAIFIMSASIILPWATESSSRPTARLSED